MYFKFLLRKYTISVGMNSRIFGLVTRFSGLRLPLDLMHVRAGDAQTNLHATSEHTQEASKVTNIMITTVRHTVNTIGLEFHFQR